MGIQAFANWKALVHVVGTLLVDDHIHFCPFQAHVVDFYLWISEASLGIQWECMYAAKIYMVHDVCLNIMMCF